MNAPQPVPGGNPPKPLNLYKFLPGEIGAPSPDNPESEGQTMMIRRIAAKTVEAQVSQERQETDEYGLPVKEMLGVIGHCFARGVYCSKDISQLLKDEPALRKQFGRRLPDEQTIRRFRRRFADEPESTLGTLYKADPTLAPTLMSAKSANTEFLHKQVVDLVHDAAWTDNSKGRLG